MIHDVRVIPLRQIGDERGKVMHMLRVDAPHFQGFGEIYFSTVLPGRIKAWHVHRRMIRNYAVPVGNIRLVLFDDRYGSPTNGEIQEINVGSDHYNLIIIPSNVWSGFAALGNDIALVANCASIPHDPHELERLHYNDTKIPYVWDLKSE